MTRFLGAVVPVDDREAVLVVLSFVYFFCLLGGYYIIRPVRDAMGTLGGVRELSWLFTGTFVAMLTLVPLFGAAVSRLPPQRFVPLVYRASIVILAAFAVLIHAGVAPARVAQAFFIWTSVFNLFVVSVFWSVMADIFRSDQGKRLYGFIAAGGTAGTLVGSALTTLLAERLGLTALLVMSAVLLEAAVRCACALFRRQAQEAPLAAESPSAAETSVMGGTLVDGLVRVVASPYLLGICFYILCLTVTATVAYFQQNDIVRRSFADPEVKTAFFALLDLLVNLLTVLLQLLVTARLLAWFGVAVVLAIVPALVAAGMLGLAAAPVLAILALFQVIRRAAGYALAHPSREILFTVVSRADKYKSKNVIDTVVYRGGDMVAAWAYSGLAALGLGLSTIALTAVPVALVWLFTAVLLGRAQAARSRRT